ncbi:MAG: ATP-dependent DNA helicase RecG [bacterium]
MGLSLNDPVRFLPSVGPKYEVVLERLDILTVKDLIYHFPKRYIDTRTISTLKDSLDGEYHTVKVRIDSHFVKKLKGFKKLIITKISDDSMSAQILWFNQEYIINQLKEGDTYLMYGKLKFLKTYSFTPVELENVNSSETLGHIVPVYSATRGITQKWLRARQKLVQNQINQIYSGFRDLPKDILEKFNLSSFLYSIKNAHFPREYIDLEKSISRLAFDEMYEVVEKIEKKKENAVKFKAHQMGILKASKMKLGFELTHDQKNSVSEILEDLSKDIPMNRLLMGDVGSGKTAVSVIASNVVLGNGFDVVLLCPTTVLASQHKKTIDSMLEKSGYEVVLMLGGTKVKKELVSEGKKHTKSQSRPRMYITTHSILYKDPKILKNVGLVIVDEQHKFGVEQREQIFNQIEGKKPHLLMMSATPIPRTVAETFFTDLNVSIIKTKPLNRKPIRTYIVPEDKRKEGYDWIKERIKKSEQIYIVCPLIEQNEDNKLKNVKEEFERIKKIFTKYKVELVHGKIKEIEKNKILDDFKSGKIDILVSTQVIEVGIDNPNATVMVIESAERFGLAQLHQLRGRVGRGEKQSFCLLFTSAKIEKEASEENNINGQILMDSSEKGLSEKSVERLKYFSTHTDGFELSEFDLKLRGPGEVYGTMQSGIPKFKFASIVDHELISKCQQVYKILHKNIN